MYRPALQERLREASATRPHSAVDTSSRFGASRPQSASSVINLQTSSDFFRQSSLENPIDGFPAPPFVFSSSRPQSAMSSANGSSKSMRDDAKLVFQELQRIHSVADYTLKFSSSTGSCSADMLRDYLQCLEQHAGSLEKPFSTFLQQERSYCKERADVLAIFHHKYLDLVRTSLKQLAVACNILKQVDDKKHREANSAHQGNVSAAQVQILLNAKIQELNATQSSFAQTLETKQSEFLVSQSRCSELTKELHEIKEFRDQEIAKSKEWYQWELQFAEDKLDQAELKIQLLQEQLLQMKNGLVMSSTKGQLQQATTQSSGLSKGTQTFWKTGDVSDLRPSSSHSSLPESLKSSQHSATKDSGMSLTDDDDDDDATKSRLRKFLIPSAAGDIQSIKRKALVELILDGTLESGSIEYLKAVDTGKSLSKALLLRSISEVYATRTLLLQSGESISPYLTHDLGRFTLAHYRQRFGLKKTAERRTSGIIRAVRLHRSSSNRIDLFGQFFGIDSNLPPKCLDIYLKLLIYIENMPEAPHIENDDATAVCWVPLEKFIVACEKVIEFELDSQDLEDIFAKAEMLAVPNAKKKHIMKINFDKICCSIFSRVIHASQATSEMEVTSKLLSGIQDSTDESGISRRTFFEIISTGNPSIVKSSTDTLFDEGIKRQHGLLNFKSDDGRLRLSPETCSNLISEFVLDGAPGHAPGLDLQKSRQTVLDALTTFWMRNGKIIETKLKESQIVAARLSQTMHLFFKGYLQKENTLSLWILTRSMIADLKLGKTILERTANPESTATLKMKGTVKKLMMVSCIDVIVQHHFHYLSRCEKCALQEELRQEFLMVQVLPRRC
jgi:hypothetical protein